MFVLQNMFDCKLACLSVSDFRMANPVVSWCYRVSTGTGWPGVSILCLGEIESLTCNLIIIIIIILFL